ncbi:MAG: signal peptidase II [Candidatus Woesearchaeota archaeon]|nr:signal peptidase II [Candidatus Woesearchaeota archaeon]
MRHAREILFASIAAGILFIDQLVKDTVSKSIPLNEEIAHRAFFSITYSQNHGASFGILQGKTMFLIWFSVAVLIGIVWYLRKTPTTVLPYVALIAGGAVSNLVDRVNLGYVIDYINFFVIPTFNIADAAITVGTAGIAWWMYFKKEK